MELRNIFAYEIKSLGIEHNFIVQREGKVVLIKDALKKLKYLIYRLTKGNNFVTLTCADWSS